MHDIPKDAISVHSSVHSTALFADAFCCSESEKQKKRLTLDFIGSNALI